MAQNLGIVWIVLFIFKNKKDEEKTSGQDLYFQSSKDVESDLKQSVSSIGLTEVQTAEQLHGDTS